MTAKEKMKKSTADYYGFSKTEVKAAGTVVTDSVADYTVPVAEESEKRVQLEHVRDWLKLQLSQIEKELSAL